jgi:hypothetical protein
MAIATAQDDDLLIIADDSVSDNSSDDIEFSFDFGEDSAEKKETSSVEEGSPEITETPIDLGINFDTSSEESKVEAKTETHEVAANEEFSFDLGEVSEAKQEESKIEESPVEESPVEEGITAAKVSSEVESTNSTGDDTSMNDILSGTIAKLAARQDVIATDKASKSKSEEEIKAQIKDLQEQVKELESEMDTLDSESNKITANIAELENMKLDPVKEHNAKRVVKK